MPLDLEPVLDLEPLDEERPERADQPLFTPPPVEPSVPSPMSELPADPNDPNFNPGLPPRLSPEEWDRLKKASELRAEQADVRTGGELIARGEDVFDKGLIPPQAIENLMAVGAPAVSATPGVAKSIAQNLSGLTTPVNLAIGAGAAATGGLPLVTRGIAGGFAADIAQHMPELGTAAGEASVTGTPEEQQKAFADIGASALMGGLAGGGAVTQPAPIPPTILQAIVKHGETLPKAAAAVVKKVTKDIPQQLETPIEKGVPSAEAIRSDTGQVREAGRQPEVVQDQGGQNLQQPAPEPAQPVGAQAGQKPEVLLSPEAITLDEFVKPEWEAYKQRVRSGVDRNGRNFPADIRKRLQKELKDIPEKEAFELFKAQWRDVHKGNVESALEAGKDVPAEVLKEYPELKPNTPGIGAVRRVEAMPDAEAAKLNQRGEQYEGLNLTPEDAPALKAARDASGERLKEVFAEASAPGATPEAQLAAQAELGRNIWISGAIEFANKKGPNYEAAQAAKAAAQPAPVEPARVAGVPAEVPAAKAPVAEVPPAAPIDITPTKALAEKVTEPAAGAKLTPAERVELNELRITRENRGLGRLNTERLVELEAKEKAANAPEAVTPESAVGGAPVAATEWNGRPLSYWKSIAVPQKLGKGDFRTQLAKTLGVADTPKSVATALQAKIVEIGAAQPFFERESEVAGLGRSSLPPTVADIRAQRAFEARQRAAAAAKESGFVPDTRGTTEKMRKSAERATEAPAIPEPVRERIAEAPESQYTQQSMARVEEAVATLPDAELAQVPRDSDLYTAARLEQAKRLFDAGKNEEGYQVFVELEKEGTRLGQLINQFKLLESSKPEQIVAVINKQLEKAGKDILNPAQTAKALDTARQAKAADAELKAATSEWEKSPTSRNAARAEAALDASNNAAVELQQFVTKFQPRSTASILKAVLQGNLLTPISEVANLVGNMSFLPFRAIDRSVATGLDIIDAAVRNKPRELSVQPVAGTLEAAKGAARGLAKVPAILAEGGNVIKGETRAGLHPVKAWINQFVRNPEMPTTGGKLTLKDRVNLAIEGTFGVPAEVMLRGLGAGDAPFKEAARARVTAEQLRLADIPREQWDFAQKFPELFLPRKALDQIHRDTMAAVFQGESKALNYITNLAKSRGEMVDLFWATIAPYKLTPWNIVSEILSYNPLVAMAKSLNDVRTGNTRSAKLNAGKLVVGSMLTGTGIWLYKRGLLAPSLDERSEAQKARILSGQVLPPNHINISGLKRAMAGGDPAFQPGDETRDVFRAGGLAGSIFYMTANIGRDLERGPKVEDTDMWTSILRQSTLEQARFGLNQSFLSGVEGLLTAVKEGSADNFLRQWMNTVASIPLPNTLNTINRAARLYQPDMKAKDFGGTVENMFRNKTGLTEYLPLKRDLWGEPMRETPEGRDALAYHFFDITKGKQVTDDPVALELYRLWRKTGDNKVIPSIPERSMTVAKTTYALDPQQYERYAELAGRNRRHIVDALVINPQYQRLTEEQKLKLLDRAYDSGLERAKATVFGELGARLIPKAQRAGFTP